MRPDDFAAASASWARSISSSAGSSPFQRATPAEAVCPRGVAARTRSSTSTASPSPQDGRISANSTPSMRATESTSRSSLRQRRRGLLDQAVALALAAQHVERAHVVEVEPGDRQRRVRATGARDLARQLLLEHPPRDQAGQLIGQRQRLDARPQARVLDRDRGLRRDQPQHARGGLGQRVQRPLPDHDQDAADLAVAQDRLEDGGPGRRRLDQRRGQRRMVARVGDEVRLLGGERLAEPGPSPRGWIVTGCTETPAIAVEEKSRPLGSSRNATGASITSQAASQIDWRASSPAASALATRPIAPIPLA